MPLTSSYFVSGAGGTPPQTGSRSRTCLNLPFLAQTFCTRFNDEQLLQSGTADGRLHGALHSLGYKRIITKEWCKGVSPPARFAARDRCTVSNKML